jgi:hypothetical protein
MNTLALILVGLLAAPGAAGPPVPEIGSGADPAGTRYPFRAECAVHLIELGRRIETYTRTHGGALPDKLSDLFVGDELEARRHLVCPGMKPLVTQGGFLSSYAYVTVETGRRTIEDVKDAILAFDLQPVHQDGRNVLWMRRADRGVETHVTYLKEAEFQETLAEQQAIWKEKSRPLRVVERDLIPLKPQELDRLTEPGGPSFFDSVHFPIALVLVLGIAVCLVLLALRARRSRPPEGPDPI